MHRVYHALWGAVLVSHAVLLFFYSQRSSYRVGLVRAVSNKTTLYSFDEYPVFTSLFDVRLLALQELAAVCGVCGLLWPTGQFLLIIAGLTKAVGSVTLALTFGCQHIVVVAALLLGAACSALCLGAVKRIYDSKDAATNKRSFIWIVSVLVVLIEVLSLILQCAVSPWAVAYVVSFLESTVYLSMYAALVYNEWTRTQTDGSTLYGIIVYIVSSGWVCAVSPTTALVPALAGSCAAIFGEMLATQRRAVSAQTMRAEHQLPVTQNTLTGLVRVEEDCSAQRVTTKKKKKKAAEEDDEFFARGKSITFII